MHTITLQNVQKEIKNSFVLQDINLTLQSGKVYGFVGRNGSGKSMLFRILSGLIRPTNGTIAIDEKELYKETSYIGDIGLVIENARLYDDLTGLDNLRFLAKLKNKITDHEIKNAIERVGLDPADSRTLKKYSLGMKQRITIAQAIMEKPDYIFLDEPTNALDEKGIEQLYQIVKEEVSRGALICIASHNKTDIDLLCETVYHMADGKISPA